MVALSNVTQFQTKAGKVIEDFLNENAMRSEATYKNYKSDISKFLLSVFDKTIYTITFEELELLDYESFKAFLNSYHGKLANSTINRLSSSIESLYKHLMKTNSIKSDIAFFKLNRSLPTKVQSYDVMPIEVVKQYVDAALKEIHKGVEKKWAIILAIELGLRSSEIVDLEWSQFKVDGEKTVVNGYGKGNVKYTEIMDTRIYEDLRNDLRGNQKKVFTLSQKNITDMMIRLRKELGQEDRNYTFHSFKKTSVNYAYLVTGNILDAQAKGKHAKLETTQIYLQEVETKMTGYFSLEKNLNHDLYKEVDYNTLINTLKTMPKELLFLLNMKLNDSK